MSFLEFNITNLNIHVEYARIKKYFTEILADTMTMLGTRGDGSGSAQGQSEPGRMVDTPSPQIASGPSDDLPF